MNNIIKTENSTIIFNGGNPLPGCPSSWDEARIIEEKFNEGKEMMMIFTISRNGNLIVDLN
jgi:hypothetical protein